MGTRVWIDGSFDRKLTEKQEQKLEKWLSGFVTYDFGQAGATRIGFYVGWLCWDDSEEVYHEILKHLPKGVSVELTREYEDCEDPGKELSWHGPRAIQMEIEHIDREMSILVNRKGMLMKELDVVNNGAAA